VEDLRPYLENCLAVAIPIRFGTGTRLKILHAMAAGCPVVSTGLGAEGIGAVDGKEIVIADSAAGFARAIARFEEEPAFARSIGDAGRAFVQRSYDWTTIVSDFETTLRERVARVKVSGNVLGGQG
jgi:glycosyltransferase involved in cell wall biosynthesis